MLKLDTKSEEKLYSFLKKESLRRWLGMGGSDGDIFPTYRKIKGIGDWCREFSNLAEGFEKTGDAAASPLAKAQNYRLAAVYYHIAQLGIFEDTDEKKEAFLASMRAYTKGAPYYWVPVEVVEYAYQGVKLKAYFRRSPDSKNAPCAILIKGADSSAEGEGHVVSNYFLQRGMSTFSIDCSGQCYARWQGLRMAPDFEKPIGAALDYLKTRPDVDNDKVGILGLCFGGFIVPRAAAYEKRLKACVSVGGFYGMEEFEYPLPAVLNIRNDMKVTETQWPEEIRKYTLKGVIEKMTAPLLVVNGSEDHLLPVSQCVRIYENARCPKELKIYQGYPHNVYNDNKGALIDWANWMWDKLQGQGY